jgi:hypothetical protein
MSRRVGDARPLLNAGEGELGRGGAAHGDMLASLEARGGMRRFQRREGEREYRLRVSGHRWEDGFSEGYGSENSRGPAEDPDPQAP